MTRKNVVAKGNLVAGCSLTARLFSPFSTDRPFYASSSGRFDNLLSNNKLTAEKGKCAVNEREYYHGKQEEQAKLQSVRVKDINSLRSRPHVQARFRRRRRSGAATAAKPGQPATGAWLGESTTAGQSQAKPNNKQQLDAAATTVI